jgi:type I restriction enzyme S subunit
LSCSKQTTNLASINSTQLKEMPLLLPPLDEQRRIADALATWDRAIDVAKSLAVAKRRLFEMLREVLFQPEGSEDLFTFGDVLSESRIPGSDGTKAQKLTVKLYGKGVVAKEARIVGSENTRYFTRRAGQFIYSKLDFLNGAFGLLPPELDGFESTLDLPAFDIDLNVNPTWLVHYLSRPSFYEAQVELGKGQRIARRVNPSDFVALPLPLPPRPRQDAVVNVLDQALSSQLLCEQQLDALRAQKRGLMQKLLTGEWRLPHSASEHAA